ncbi:hypothetical protein BDB00DRAFT_876673 [Zychaea mexicana]|uniref:uncharacterized protein n=1 Tax=Zychaea mexicana TaxID=64656 RepID=UPI0022FEB5A7|nr:uncharacterized protein BDB00DRAFT_876673 [Zychaea mexicana]KAI9489202.1 hypothetical protein BDB00DRAFT_876673 [Zychaea mexicana]
MALPAKDPDSPLPANQTDHTSTPSQPPPSAATSPSPSTSKGKQTNVSFRSYAQATKGHCITTLGQVTGSEYLTNTTSANNSTDDTAQALTSQPLFRRGSEEFSIFYDVTGDKLGPKAFFDAARARFPTGVGLGRLTHRDNGRVLVEIILNSEQSCTQACETPLQVTDEVSYTATRSLPPDNEVFRVTLDKLPIIPLVDLEKGLRSCLSQYGRILYLGLYDDVNANTGTKVEPKTFTFNAAPGTSKSAETMLPAARKSIKRRRAGSKPSQPLFINATSKTNFAAPVDNQTEPPVQDQQSSKTEVNKASNEGEQSLVVPATKPASTQSAEADPEHPISSHQRDEDADMASGDEEPDDSGGSAKDSTRRSHSK